MIDPDLPLIDLHRHLDGNVRLETILELSQKHNITLPAHDIEGLRPFVQVTHAQPGVMAFLERFRWLTAVMVDFEACRRIAYENVEDAHREGLDYIELRFSPWFMSRSHNLDPVGIVESVLDGISSGIRDFDIPVKVIGILSRTYGPEIAWRELEALLSQADKIVALDLAGDEAGWPGELFVRHFCRARENGWRVTIHAGEIDGSRSIWQAVKELGAERIGHAVRATEDPVLIEYLYNNKVGVEINLTSNFQTSTVKTYQDHPAKYFLEYGLLATLCSDDPVISGIDLRYEYEIAARAAGLSEDQLQQSQKNALEIAFLTIPERQNILNRKMGKNNSKAI